MSAVSSELQHCGALPWRIDRHGATRILLVTPPKEARWSIPQGCPLDDQPGFLAASRQAFEKAGLIGDILTQPLTDYLFVKRFEDGSARPCRVSVYSMKVYGTLSNWPRQHRTSRSWFSVEEAADRLDDIELAEFLRAGGLFPAELEHSFIRPVGRLFADAPKNGL